MIPRAYINAWRSVVPWQMNEQVEQDLIISRALVNIFSDDFLKQKLAFRGGTALYKLYLGPVRYSEDIDLIQVDREAIGPVFDRLKEVLHYLGIPGRIQRKRNSTLVFRFDSEFEPVVKLKLKVEINCREHFSLYRFQEHLFSVESPWFSGEANIKTFTLEELLGSKLRALYQRNKGRDLFDVWYALNNATVDQSRLIQAFYRFMEESGSTVSRVDFTKNLEAKIQNRQFLSDIDYLIKPDIKYDANKAFPLVMEKLISQLA